MSEVCDIEEANIGMACYPADFKHPNHVEPSSLVTHNLLSPSLDYILHV